MILRTLAALLLFTLPAAAQDQIRIDLSEGEGTSIILPEAAASIFVADPGVADAQAASGRRIYVSAVAPGMTTLTAVDFEDRTIGEYAVHVTPDNREAAGLMDRGNGVQGNRNVAVVRGSAGGVDGARRSQTAAQMLRDSGRVVVDQSTVAGGTQVQLRVRFVEASRRDLRRLGVDLSGFGEAGGNPIRFVTGLGDPTGFLGGATQGSPAFGIRGTSGELTVDGMIDALESRGVVQILSEPTLTTVSGRRASFQAGGEIAYPVAQGDGVITAGFRPYGVSIDFLPTVLQGERIALEVSPEVSFIDAATSVQVEGFSAPGLSVRRANTTVELGSGQTFAIAGLYEQLSSNESSGVPGLSRIFGENEKRREERELMIFITPYFAKASDATRPRSGAADIASTVGFLVK